MPSAGVDLTPESVIDISHESLIRGWTRLKKWTEEEAQSARTYKRLADTAALHEAKQEGLLKDPALQVALDWKAKNKPNEVWARRYRAGFQTAMTFLDDSVEARNQEAVELQRQQKRDTSYKRSRILVAVLVPATILFVAMFVYVYFKNKKATVLLAGAIAQQNVANQSAENARLAMSAAINESTRAKVAMSAAIDESNKAQMQMSDALRERDAALKLKQLAEAERGKAQAAQEVAEIRTREAEAAKETAERAEAAAVGLKEKAEQAEKDAIAQKKIAEDQRDLADRRAAQLEAQAAEIKNQADQIAYKDKALADVTSNRSLEARPGDGIDVSHHNGAVDWEKLGKTGIAFAFIKATQGRSVVDPAFKDNVQKAQAAKILTGAYHTLSASADPKTQAELFLKTVGRDTVLRPVLMVEPLPSERSSVELIENNMRIWLQIVEKEMGCKPIIETGNIFARETIKSPEFGQYPLWIVQYAKKPEPTIPPLWTKWLLWNYTDSGTFAGTYVGDLNRLSGSLDDLKCR
jgi:GH25 family lysozyme M1 (1,4-beta-N-acetylmuramidase)